VIGIVLIAQNTDDLAVVMLETLAEDLQQQVSDIVATPGPGKELGGNRAHAWLCSWSLSGAGSG
jgi:hypothetical protein